jgi:hypothetical protein
LLPQAETLGFFRSCATTRLDDGDNRIFYMSALVLAPPSEGDGETVSDWFWQHGSKQSLPRARRID